MLRLIPLLALMPTAAAADWAPRPAMFSYDAVFDLCIADPAAPDLARACERRLAAAYALKRATVLATNECYPDDLATCAAPFEDQGLPAISMRIAVDVGCDATDLTTLDGPLPRDHCAAIASDIMIDEGVVPLFIDISCGIDWIECGDLADINAAFWVAQTDAIAPDDPFIDDLQARNFNVCTAESLNIQGWGQDLNALECIAAGSAAIWADITIQDEQGN